MKTALDAKRLFLEHIQGVNIMTPYAIEYGWRGLQPYELCEGRGIEGEPIYGVTVLDKNNRIDSDRGRLFHDLQEAHAYLRVVIAPFTPEEVEGLRSYQGAPWYHPFTCANRGDGKHRRGPRDYGVLEPSPEGWFCPDCDYTQDWANKYMVLGAGERPF